MEKNNILSPEEFHKLPLVHQIMYQHAIMQKYGSKELDKILTKYVEEKFTKNGKTFSREKLANSFINMMESLNKKSEDEDNR